MKKSALIYSSLLIGACSYTPSQELVRAQESYRQAYEGQTAQIAPAELHQAKVAVDEAAAADKHNQGTEDTVTKTYVAQRKVEWANAVATKKIAANQKELADKGLVEGQGKLLTEQQKQLQNDQQIKEKQATALINKQQELTTSKAETEQQRQAALDAAEIASRSQEREAEALAKLKIAEKMAEDARGQVVTLPSGLLFKTNQSTILPGAYTRLDQVAQSLQQMPNKQMLIEGHTDSVGNDSNNLELSSRRAQAVRDYLVAKGLDGSKVRIQGAGKSRPIADNTSTEGRALNRRVEIVILKDSQDKAASK